LSFKWKEAYSCNIAEIDKQHKRLFEIGDRLYELATLNDNYDHYDEIVKTLDELKDYTIYHFGYEEKLMEQYGFSYFEPHKIEHDFFVKKLKKLERKDFDENQGEAVVEMLQFVADWISAHILKTDMEYKDFFNGKGIY
jgi:hemerythrin